MAAPASVALVRLDEAGYREALPDLAELLVNAVDHGAGVNFVAPLAPDIALAWWSDRAAQVETGIITPIVAREPDGSIVGVVLLIRAQQPNGQHRADISKLLVHSAARRRGIARALMTEVEATAREAGRWLLVLDTETGSSGDATYRALGWTAVGTIPDFALLANGVPGPATIFYKDLR